MHDTRKSPAAYREVAQFYDEHYHRDPTACTRVTREHRQYSALLGLAPGRRLLDVACGTGGWLRSARAAGAECFGIDISTRALHALAASAPDLLVCAATGEQLPFAGRHFDAITCLGSLEHFLDQEAALREMVRVAAPGASMLIIVPNSGFLTWRLGLYRGTEQARVRETLRSIAEWEAMFEGAGLAVLRRWADRHVLNRGWIMHRGAVHALPRLLQALLLYCWPLDWQYQVCFLCRAA